MMKKIFYTLLPVLFFFGFLPDAAGQINIFFDYDAAGNRILRSMDTPPAPLAAFVSDTVVVAEATPASDSIPATFRVSMYPNPVQTNLSVHIEILDASLALPSAFNVRIVSMQGAVVYNQTHAGTTPIQVNLHNSQVGYYQLTVTRGNEIHQLTIVKI